MGMVVRPYNDWRENLAVNILAPIIGGAIQQQQQRDYNRKYNAYQGELAKQIADQSLPQITPDFQMPEANDAWGSSARRAGNSALADFDNNTVSIMPPSMQPVQPSWPTQRTLSMQEIQNIANGLASTKRFSMMNPTDVQAITKQFVDTAVQEKKIQDTKELADKLLSNPDAVGRMNMLDSAAIQGTISPELLDRYYRRYTADRPQPVTTDLGGSIMRETYNPVTGEFSNPTTVDKTMTPQQVWENAYKKEVFDYTKQKDARDFIEGNRRFGITSNQTQQQIDMQRQPKYNVVTIDNQAWLVDQYGNRQKFDPNSVALSNFEMQQVQLYQGNQKTLWGQRSELMKRREALLKQTPEGSPEIEEITQSIAAIDNEIKGYDEKINSIYKNKINAPQGQQSGAPNAPRVGAGMDIGSNMISHSNNGVISTSFNTPRTKKDGTKYGHAGTDYPAPKGQPILLDDVGVPMTVTKVANDPNGYGNYVDLEGDLNGHKIGLRVAHMGDGTVKVSRGQTVYMGEQIGAVGNTGNSRGKNGGYHLHLETTIDGQRMDPVKFKEQIASFIKEGHSNSQSGQENATPNSNPPTTANVSVMPPTISNDVSQDWRPSYQTVNSSLAMTGSPNMKNSMAEQRGLNNINGTDKPEVSVPLNEDTDFVMTASNPKTSPEKYPAPEYIDIYNRTRPEDLKALEDALNGVGDVRPEILAWSNAAQRQYPSFDDFIRSYV